MKWLVITSAFLLLTLSAHAATWFVDKDNTGIEDGTSWATAFTTIQPAIDAAFADGGGDVWVSEGTYDEGRTSLVHSPAIDTGSLIMKTGVDLFGGFTGTETMLSQRDFVNNVTTIDGSTARSGSPAHHVVFVEGAAVINGFTITGGVAANIGDPLLSRFGGGLFNSASGTSACNCTFTGNIAPTGGGGGLQAQQQITIENCTFAGNSSFSSGGGAGTSSATVVNCLFESNSVSNGGGGGLTLSGSGAIASVTNCEFRNNSASGGTALSAGVADATISQCIFRSNTSSSGSGAAVSVGFSAPNTHNIVNCIFASNEGGALVTSGVIQMDANPSTDVTVTNCTIWGNMSGSDGGAIRTNNTSLTVVNSILWNNGPVQLVFSVSDKSITHSDIQGGFLGEGNINAEPFFVDATNGDFRVFSGSAVIDAGTSAGAPATDIDGIARPQGAEVDLGAHESDGSLAELSAAQVVALVTLTLILALLIVAKVKRVSHLI